MVRFQTPEPVLALAVVGFWPLERTELTEETDFTNGATELTEETEILMCA